VKHAFEETLAKGLGLPCFILRVSRANQKQTVHVVVEFAKSACICGQAHQRGVDASHGVVLDDN